VQLVGAHDVLLPPGRGKHHDRDPPERVVALDLGQHLAAVLAREVEVEQDQAGARRRGEGRLPS
jgi:hypothetical protein